MVLIEEDHVVVHTTCVTAIIGMLVVLSSTIRPWPTLTWPHFSWFFLKRVVIFFMRFSPDPRSAYITKIQIPESPTLEYLKRVFQFRVYLKETGEAEQRRGEAKLRKYDAEPLKEEVGVRTLQGREEERRSLYNFCSELRDWRS